jgi:hypothetical protein
MVNDVIRLQMEPTLHDELVNVLYSVSILQTRAGRDSLLIGIPSHDSWHRPDGNNEVDLRIIVDNLKDTFLGDTEEESTWALLCFIDRAIKEVEKTSKARDLRKLREKCVQCLKMTLTKQISSDTFNANKAPNIVSTHDSLNPPDSNIPLSIVTHKKDILPEQNLNFFEAASTCLIEARQSTIGAYTYFENQLFVYVTPSQKRKAVTYLETSIFHFEMLLKLLHETVLLPEEVALHHQLFVDQINYLIEQFKRLISWISKENAVDSTIQDIFINIKKEMQIFIIVDKMRITVDSDQ